LRHQGVPIGEGKPAPAQQSFSAPYDIGLRVLLAALDRAAAASLAGGIIASSGQAHTPEQAIAVQREVLRTMFLPRQ
jgi:hypothetical protein